MRIAGVLAGLVALGVVCAAPVSAEPLVDVVCGTLERYPAMGPVDVALMLSEDRAVFYSYDAARWAVDSIVASDCPELAR